MLLSGKEYTLYAQNSIVDIILERNCMDFSNDTENGMLAVISNTMLKIMYDYNNNIATPGGMLVIKVKSQIMS